MHLSRSMRARLRAAPVPQPGWFEHVATDLHYAVTPPVHSADRQRKPFGVDRRILSSSALATMTADRSWALRQPDSRAMETAGCSERCPGVLKAPFHKAVGRRLTQLSACCLKQCAVALDVGQEAGGGFSREIRRSCAQPRSSPRTHNTTQSVAWVCRWPAHCEHRVAHGTFLDAHLPAAIETLHRLEAGRLSSQPRQHTLQHCDSARHSLVDLLLVFTRA